MWKKALRTNNFSKTVGSDPLNQKLETLDFLLKFAKSEQENDLLQLKERILNLQNQVNSGMISKELEMQIRAQIEQSFIFYTKKQLWKHYRVYANSII